jgi:hypothetical protein
METKKKSPDMSISHFTCPSPLLIAKMQLLELFFPIHPLNVAPINRESVNNGEETKGPMVECHFVTLSYVSRQKTFPVKVEMYKFPRSKTGDETTDPTSVTHRSDGLEIGLDLDKPVLLVFPLNIFHESTEFEYFKT